MTENLTNSTSWQIYLRLLAYLEGLKFPFAVSVFGYLLFAGTQPMLAKLMEVIIEAIQNKNLDARWSLPFLAVGIFAVRGIGSFLGDYYNEFVGASVIRKLKIEVFNHLTVLPTDFFDKATHGQLLHRLNNGVNRVKAAITNALKTVVKEGLTVLALLGYVFYLNWQLSLLFLLIAPVLAMLVTATNRKFREIGRRAEGAGGKALQVSKELMGNYSVVRGFGAENYEFSRYRKAVDMVYQLKLRISKLASLFTPVSQLIVATAVAAIIFLLLTPAVLAESTTGELVGYLTAVALIPKPLRQLSRVTVTIQRGLIGAELVFGLLDRKPEEDTGELTVDRVKGDIQVKNLSFKYPGTSRWVLNNVSLDVKPGEMIALVGKSGGGKTTLASLLYRLYRVPPNTVFLDGIDINDYKLDNLRSHIAAVNQNVALFDDSVRNNIAYGDAQYSDEEISDAARQAHAMDFIDQLEQGLDTLVGEDGALLSGGQRQRLSIARAFLKAAPVLILDEATSALDSASEKQVTKAMEALAASRTTVVIAHRLSTIRRANRLFVLEDGCIVETGSHEELLTAKGAYYQLYMSEFSDDKKVES
ncbi:MAG: lipid A export permease/ATP-binding protein MsbA [Pseudomonadales bacterium]|nr:lipid A export permease/ATP-binding protein MsbA [Pseudomonadales bacterium]